MLKEHLSNHGYHVRIFREPGGTPVSEQIREILLNSGEDIHPLAETLLFSAARAQLVAAEIQPLLATGNVVILDRFYDSTTAYQGYGRGVMPVYDIEKLNALATSGLQPDITFYLKIDPDKAYRRRRKNEVEDRMERSGREFYLRVSEGFDKMAARMERMVTLDASQDPETIFHSLIAHLRHKLTRL